MTITPGAVAAIDPVLREQLEAMLSAEVGSQVSWLDKAVGRMVRRPAKRLRPALTLTVAGCGPAADMSTALACAAGVELLHQSSLIHDDLMDGAKQRGGETTLHASDGLVGALLGGDYLVAAGGRLVARAGREAAEVWHTAYAQMCEGQARETANRHRLATEDEYLRTVRGKTGALFAAACHLGALCGGMPAPQVRAFAEFGAAFGVLFQLVDDLMDAVSTAQLWGKPVEHDVAQGIYPLPVLTAARLPGSPLPELLGRRLSAEDVSTVYRFTRDVVTAPMVATVYDWAAQAEAALASCPRSTTVEALAHLPEQYATATLTERVAAPYQPLVTGLLPRPRTPGRSKIS